MTTKLFDCVEMVEAIQEDIQKQLESMSPEEQIAYWHARAEQLRGRQKPQMEVKTRDIQRERALEDPTQG